MMRHIAYYPLTATPFKRNRAYAEAAPCKQLESFVRCFWGTEQPVIHRIRENTAEIVVPDTCVDIIYYIDYTENKVTGGFCGINDHSFYAYSEEKQGHTWATFAIRFFCMGGICICG